ncbi:MAG: putative molybdenum carrier protein [Candidatus Thiodiazotropha sp. (ex Rostrolucina anterorostrata)]|nr:putative molybdenum carrier protein [Candidatus Thiodiazotropha sp. (ex Rostrolucina anterorostrata)]
MMKIISGAQTGVDRAALDAALECGIQTGGWCPQGRLAEDGTIPKNYPVKELAGAGYKERTLKNVIDSDGTMIVYYDCLSGGTEQTLRFCLAQKKPYLLIDAEEVVIQRAVSKVLSFIEKYRMTVLNVAGPRASGEARAYDYTKQVIEQVLKI